MITVSLFKFIANSSVQEKEQKTLQNNFKIHTAPGNIWIGNQLRISVQVLNAHGGG
jgi:hypothetical protein